MIMRLSDSLSRIYHEIGNGERIALSKLATEKIDSTGRPLRIAVDISIWSFQIQSGKGQTQHPVICGRMKQQLMTLAHQEGRIRSFALYITACYACCLFAFSPCSYSMDLINPLSNVIVVSTQPPHVELGTRSVY